MIENNDHKLDNPVWHSVTESNATFAFSGNNDKINFYHPDYCPFGGFTDPDNNQEIIDEYASQIHSFFLVGEKPVLSASLNIQSELICLQMVAEGRIEMEKRDEIVKLTTAHHQSLIQLVNLVQPGFFKDKTPLLGDYFGIFKEGELIAITGERMKMNGFTELSAIITHPDHTGKGYAKQLIAHVMDHVFDQHKIPFLHVNETNTGAIGLYEKMGFKTRRKMSFWYITK